MIVVLLLVIAGLIVYYNPGTRSELVQKVSSTKVTSSADCYNDTLYSNCCNYTTAYDNCVWINLSSLLSAATFSQTGSITTFTCTLDPNSVGYGDSFVSFTNNGQALVSPSSIEIESTSYDNFTARGCGGVGPSQTFYLIFSQGSHMAVPPEAGQAFTVLVSFKPCEPFVCNATVGWSSTYQ